MELEEILSINITSGDADSSVIREVDDFCQMFQNNLHQNDTSRNSQLYLECHDDESNDILLGEQIDALHKERSQSPVCGSHVHLVKCTSVLQRPSLAGSWLTNCLGNMRLKCSLCSRSFTRRNLLQDHMASVHKFTDLFPCALCKYKGQRYRHWFKHMKRMHPEAELILEQEAKHESEASVIKEQNDGLSVNNQTSPKTEEQQVNVPEDVQTHSEKNTSTDCHLCQVCGKVFKSKKSLRYHKRIHVEKRHTCLIPGCRKSFKNSSALNEHRATVHGVHVYRCPEMNCTKMYALKRDLDYHYQVHIGTFACTVDGCTKTFRDQHSLSLHTKTHTGEKDQNCRYCSYACVQRYALRLHEQRRHKDELLAV